MAKWFGKIGYAFTGETEAGLWEEDVIEKVRLFLAKEYNERTQMGLAARAKVEREFDRKIVVNAYVDEIKTLMINS